VTTDQQRPDPTVVALGRAVERAVGRIEELDGIVRQLATDVHTLASRLAGPPPDTAEEDEPPAVRSWLLADDPEQAAADVADLAAWLADVYLRYPDTALSSCWLWHPDVIEELWWLRRAHADAYDPESGTWLRVGDWHDRQRPGVVRRVRAVLGKCDLSRHASQHGRPAAVSAPSVVPLAAHATEIATAWATPSPSGAPRPAGPAPTEQQLTDADHHHSEQYRTRR
jgi:hypothetical protein